MRFADEDDIKFHLSKMGWYLGEKEIETVETIHGVDVVVDALNPRMLAYYQNGKIYISRALAYYASLPQRRFAILHEYAHAHLNLRGLSRHEKEYACDKWAILNMIKSNEYVISEIVDATRIFIDIICELETDTHPSSKSRYKRLGAILREYV
jgi:hypothetical protein